MMAVKATRLAPRPIAAEGINIHSTEPMKVTRPGGIDEVEFRFSDRKWLLRDLLRPHEVKGYATITFDMAEWLVEDCKLYVADRWLNAKTDLCRLQGFMVIMRKFSRLLPDFKGQPIDLRMRHARQVGRLLRDFNYSPAYYQHIQAGINDFVAFVRRLHPKEVRNDFSLVLPRDLLKISPETRLQNARKRLIPTEVGSQIINACLSDVQAYYHAKESYIGPAEDRWLIMRNLLSRAVRGAATILAYCVGRRVAAVCNALLDIKTEELEWVNESGQTERGVLVRFTEMKVSNSEEDVFCPGAYGELAVYAIETAKDLTARLRLDNPWWNVFLFLVPQKKLGAAKVLSPFEMNYYLNGDPGRENGIMQRHNIPHGRRVTPGFQAQAGDEAVDGRHANPRGGVRPRSRRRAEYGPALHPRRRRTQAAIQRTG
jgi:hypothetical protein